MFLLIIRVEEKNVDDKIIFSVIMYYNTTFIKLK